MAAYVSGLSRGVVEGLETVSGRVRQMELYGPITGVIGGNNWCYWKYTGPSYETLRRGQTRESRTSRIDAASSNAEQSRGNTMDTAMVRDGLQQTASSLEAGSASSRAADAL